MALTGSIQNKRPGAGVYPGAGVAKGGQQGRSALVSNGAASVKPGGSTPAASQRRVTHPGAVNTGGPAAPARPANAAPYGYHATLDRFAKEADPYRVIMRNGKRVTIRLSQMTPAEKVAFANRNKTAAPTAGSPAAPVTAAPPQVALEDSQYFMDLADAQYGLDQSLGGINADLTRLRSNVGGKTLYDTMFERANQQFDQSKRGSRNELAQGNLLRSGAMNRRVGELAGSYADTQRQIDEEYGATAVNRLETQAAQQRAAFAQQQQMLQMAAAQRAQERLAAANAAAYGQTIPGGE